MTTAEQLVEDFDTFGVALDDEKLVEKCLELCSQYGVDGEGIAACWVSFASTNGHDSITVELLEQFERDQLAKQKKSQPKKVESFPIYDASTIDDVNAVHDDQEEEDLLAAYTSTSTTPSAHTPANKTAKRQLTPDTNINKRHIGPARSVSAQFSPANLNTSVGTPSQKYSSRTNAGNVVASYGQVSDATWKANRSYTPEVSLALGGEEPLTKTYKYMFEKVRDMAEVLDDTISALADQMKDTLKTDEYFHLRTLSNESITYAGRVCCDSVGRLNTASVLLEGSRETSSGSTVPLDVSQLSEFSLFPGQIIGVRGTNTTGNRLVAQEILPGKPLPLPDNPVTITNDTGPVQMVVACGPFTTTDNLLYEPLSDLLTSVQENPPHLLVLLGPLLDSAHPLVVSNELTEPHEAVFNRCVNIIKSSLDESITQVVVVPSSRDVTAPQVYPSPPYNLGGRLRCVSDPAFLDVEGVVVALTATDVLFHLGKEEISHPPQGSDRLGRLCRHILGQQNLYPLYPPPEGMCIDQEQAEAHARLPCTPHILILPSDLRYFVKEVEGCVVINPERLAKGLGGGTYARLELHPPSTGKGTMASSVSAQVVKV